MEKPPVLRPLYKEKGGLFLVKTTIYRRVFVLFLVPRARFELVTKGHKIMVKSGSLAIAEQWHEHEQQEDAYACALRQWKASRILENISYQDQGGDRSDSFSLGDRALPFTVQRLGRM
jgi:hypothetical protein